MTSNRNVTKEDNALIGYTGFVGRNILRQKPFKYLYNTKNIEDIQQKKFNLIVCAAAPGIKWIANKNPGNDLNSVKKLINNLEKVKTEKFVLISTIDVYFKINGVNEESLIKKNNLLPYGKHRRILEEFVESRFDSTIVRLPGLFGKGLKKNIIYDFIHNFVKFIPQDSILQFYYLDYIWKDINKALENNLKIINFATEPISVKELAKKVFNFDFNNNVAGKAPYYDMRTKYGYLWGNNSPYLYLKPKVLTDIKSFVKKYQYNK